MASNGLFQRKTCTLMPRVEDFLELQLILLCPPPLEFSIELTSTGGGGVTKKTIALKKQHSSKYVGSESVSHVVLLCVMVMCDVENV